MRRNRRRLGIGVVAVAALVLTLPLPAAAHVTKAAGPLRVTMGWANEPPLVGLENSVEVAVLDASGAPVGSSGDALDVEVSFGDRRITLPLLPGERPGEFSAVLVPVRPGTYAFHLIGRVEGQAIDIEATCSDRSFECVSAASEVQFPVKDPSLGEVAEGLARELPRVEQAMDTADSARKIAIAAIVIAGLALAAAIGLALLVRRKSG